MSEIPHLPVKRIVQRVGAKRVSNAAAEELGKFLEAEAVMLSKEAQKLSEYSGRRTVMRRDIKMAKKAVK